MINFSFKNEIADSTADTLYKRANTPLYGTFLISWSVFHWQFLYTAFFVSEELIFSKTGLLKNEYLVEKFFNYTSPLFYFSWILPVIATWIVIWILPKLLLLKAFVKDEEYTALKMRERLRIRGELATAETDVLIAEGERAEAQKKVEKVDPEILWETEYINFYQSKYFHSFDKMVEAVYKHEGRTSWYTDISRVKVELPQDLLAFAHATGLVELSTDRNNNSVINFTEKGKYFVKRYTLEHVG